MNGLGNRASIGGNAQHGHLARRCPRFLPAGVSAGEMENESIGIALGKAWVVGDALVHAARWPVFAETAIEVNGSVAGQGGLAWVHGIGLGPRWVVRETAEPSRRALSRRRGKGIDLDLNERVLGVRVA